jgi:LPXTG-site transpeptidase (sortase) family protein
MKLARVNTLLLIAILGINAYIIGAPLLPMLSFWTGTHLNHQAGKLTNRLHSLSAGTVSAAPSDNRLVIPGMLLDTGIHEGRDMTALRNGPWHRPNSSTPDKGGNTVIAAHRFTYTEPKGSFYYLDKVNVGDEIGVFWQGRRYLYKVTETKTVPATAVGIESPTKDARLTLYTCTPLWMPKDRLVITAEQEKP